MNNYNYSDETTDNEEKEEEETMKRYYIKFRAYNDYILIDRFYNEVVTRGTLDDVNKMADTLGDCEESIEY